MKKYSIYVLLFCLVFVITGCTSDKKENRQVQKAETKEKEAAVPAAPVQKPVQPAEAQESAALVQPQSAEPQVAAQPQVPAEPQVAARTQIIVLDPGHSGVVAEGVEPLGPGSEEYKDADNSGTSGDSSGLDEHQLTLTVSQKLKAELEARGYQVIMTRESSDVPVSCVQRAETANQINADALVRIHANGSENRDKQGAMTICVTPENPFVPEMYNTSRALSDFVINSLCAETGCMSEGVWETDTMSGNNWSKVPTTLVEMGYMSNPEEDLRMASEEYQSKIVQGIAKGLDAYFGY